MIGIIICTTECNLACKYCYEHTDACRKRRSRAEINDAFEAQISNIEKFISEVYTAAVRAGRRARFIFHGGEPLLLYNEVLEKVFDHIDKNTDAYIQVQTNGTLVNPEFSGLCQKYGVDVTISMDGPKSLHDLYRVDAGDRGTFEKILAAADMLKKDGIRIGALATVTNSAIGKAQELFSFFYEQGIDFSVNRCFPVKGRPDEHFSVAENDYKEFLFQLYDIYRQAGDGQICIPCFDRCCHDLKEEDGHFVYRPENSPRLVVYHCETGTVSRPHQESDARVYHGSKEECIIDHLCWQQECDYENALELNIE